VKISNDKELILDAVLTMIGLVDSMNSVDRKRKRVDSRGLKFPSTPRWHLALKRYLIEEGECPPISLSDVTRIVVASGFIRAIDVCHLAQTCTDLRKTTSNNEIWSSMCHQDFPSGTTHIPPKCIAEKGYKWLYREWKRSIHDRHAATYDDLPLLPARLSSDQLFLYSHVSVNDRPVHDVPIVLTGNDLLPLLNTGQATIRLQKPLFLWPVEGYDSVFQVIPSTLQDFSPICHGALGSCPLKMIRHQMHLFSSCDGSMRCVFDEKPTRSIQRKSYLAMIDRRGIEEESFVDFGPDFSSYCSCQIPLRNSSARVAIESRFSGSLIFFAGSYVCVVEEDGKEFFAITAIDITIRKFDRSSGGCDVFDSTQLKEHGGVTLLHYLSEIQFST
jgi:hypothetical protein